MLVAFSISSTDRRMAMMLRRMSTPTTPTTDTVSKDRALSRHVQAFKITYAILGLVVVWTGVASFVIAYETDKSEREINELRCTVDTLERYIKHVAKSTGVKIPPTHTWDGIRIVYDDPRLDAIVLADMRTADMQARAWGRHEPTDDQGADTEL